MNSRLSYYQIYNYSINLYVILKIEICTVIIIIILNILILYCTKDYCVKVRATGMVYLWEISKLDQRFFMDRDQCMVLYGCKSRWKRVLSGVSKGRFWDLYTSYLLYIYIYIYVNGLPQSISSSMFMFADDIKLIRSIQSVADHILLQVVLVEMV